MNKIFLGKDVPFILLSFFIPLICFLLTSSHSLMFDDAGEFALVVKLGSIAHPPGTPSYILLGYLWNKLTSIFGQNTVDSLTIFSSICISFSSVLLYLIFKKISDKLQVAENFKSRLTCSLCAIGFATAATSWAWANTVEVYSFQVLAFSIALFGLVNYHFNRNTKSILIAAAGLACGLANHHLTMVFFLPFIPLFFLENLFTQPVKTDKKKKKTNEDVGFIKQFAAVFQMKSFLKLIVFTSLITIGFYGWMLSRAQHEYPFMFGMPSTISDLIYHVSGATYVENMSSGSDKIVSTRIPYFLKLTFFQLFVFLPFFIAGLGILITRKLFPLFWMIILFFIFLFYYQLKNNQWSSTDAYMLLPFLLLFIAVFYGAISYIDKFKVSIVLPLLLIIQIVYNFPSHDRRTYPVSDSLMKLLDKSAPKNSIVIIGDWTTVIQYYYYRLAENFRPDLVVLNNDIKFEHYRMLPVMYPEFYKEIKPEYDAFVNELMIENPQQATGTGCDLTTEKLAAKFNAVITRIENLSKTKNVFFLTDPKAHYFYSTAKMYSPNRFVSGCFSSSMAGEKQANDYFLNMDFEFLKSPMLLNDPAALDKMVDFQTMLDRYMDFYRANNDTILMIETQNAQNKVLKIQREMKKRMPFAFETN